MLEGKVNIIIAGPRDYPQSSAQRVSLEKSIHGLLRYIISSRNISSDGICIVEGGANGVDSFARDFAAAYSLDCREFPADWDRYGRAAGPRRNREMASRSDILIAFSAGTPGTSNMIRTAIDMSLEVHVIPISY